MRTTHRLDATAPLECLDCEGHGHTALYDTTACMAGPTAPCLTCRGTGERPCEARDCQDSAVDEHAARNAVGEVVDHYAFCAACLRLAQEHDRGELDPPDERHDTMRCPPPAFEQSEAS